MKEIPNEEKKEFGSLLNDLKTFVNNSFDELKEKLEEKALNKNGLNVSEKEIKGVSDNASFENEGIANICLIEENVKEIIHSVSDTIDVINFDNLNSKSNSIYYFLKNYIILS